jgi:hypothetical protein
MFQEPEVKGGKYQDDTNIRGKPFPEVVPEEQHIDRDDNGRHRQQVKQGSHPGSHLSAV